MKKHKQAHLNNVYRESLVHILSQKTLYMNVRVKEIKHETGAIISNLHEITSTEGTTYLVDPLGHYGLVFHADNCPRGEAGTAIQVGTEVYSLLKVTITGSGEWVTRHDDGIIAIYPSEHFEDLEWEYI